MKKQFVTLPYPPSANRIWRRSPAGHIYKSKEYVAWLKEAFALGRQARLRELDGNVKVQIRLYPASRHRMDIDNCIKVTLDAMQGLAYKNDRQAVSVLAELKEPDIMGARLEVAVWEAADGAD